MMEIPRGSLACREGIGNDEHGVLTPTDLRIHACMYWYGRMPSKHRLGSIKLLLCSTLRYRRQA
jgi:hypothetical protein